MAGRPRRGRHVRLPLTLRFPDAPPVAFEVWLSAAAVPRAETRYVGIAIGGVRVPQRLLGPRVEEVAPRARALDLFALPQFAAVPRQRLEAGATDVVFAVK